MKRPDDELENISVSVTAGVIVSDDKRCYRIYQR